MVARTQNQVAQTVINNTKYLQFCSIDPVVYHINQCHSAMLLVSYSKYIGTWKTYFIHVRHPNEQFCSTSPVVLIHRPLSLSMRVGILQQIM